MRAKKIFLSGTLLVVLMLVFWVVWHIFLPKWSQVIEGESYWQHAFIQDTSIISFPTELQAGSDQMISEWSAGDLLLRNTFLVEDTSRVLKAMLLLDPKYTARVILNGQELLYIDRMLIEPSSEKIETGKIKYRSSWRRRKVFIDKSQLNGYLVNGSNTIELVLSDRYGPVKVKTKQIGLHLKVQGPAPGPYAYPFLGLREYTFTKSDLPILKIDLNGRVIPDEPKTDAEMILLDNANENRLTDEGRPFQIRIERRGNSSQRMAKRSYTFSLPQAEELLGLPAAKKWVLYGPYMDRSLIRNALAYSLCAQMGRPAPKFRYVELVVNNDYRGIYMLVEKVQIGMTGIDLEELHYDPQDSSLAGGYVIEIDRSGIMSPYPMGHDERYEHLYYSIHQPKWAADDPQALSKIMDQYTNFEKELWQAQAPYDRIDVASFIDHLIITEFCRNIDGYRLSTFIYNADIKDSVAQFRIGSIWDYNFAFGLPMIKNGYDPEGYVYAYDRSIPFWWNVLLNDQEFHDQLLDRYIQLRASILSNENVTTLIDSLVSLTENSRKDNFKKWQVFGNADFWPNHYTATSYEDEIDYLKDWVKKRGEFLDKGRFEPTKQHLSPDHP